MNHHEDIRQFMPVRIAVLALSDTRTLAEDKSGDTLVERLTGEGHILAARDILPEIAERLKFLDEVGLGYLQLGRADRAQCQGAARPSAVVGHGRAILDGWARVRRRWPLAAARIACARSRW